MSTLNLTIDISQMTIGDLEVVEGYSRKEVSASQLLDVLDRIVVGGARKLPITALPEINDAISRAIKETTNPT